MRRVEKGWRCGELWVAKFSCRWLANDAGVLPLEHPSRFRWFLGFCLAWSSVSSSRFFHFLMFMKDGRLAAAWVMVECCHWFSQFTCIISWLRVISIGRGEE